MPRHAAVCTILIVAAACLCSPVPADEFDDLMGGGGGGSDSGGTDLTFDLSGQVIGRFLHDIENDHGEEDLAKLRGAVFAQGIFGINDSISFLFSGLMEYDLDTDWEFNKSGFEAQLWEFYGTFRVGPVDIVLGQQIVTWGAMDLLSVVDNVNPQRFEDLFVYMDDGYNVSPVPMARATWYFADRFSLEALWIPFFQPMDYDLLGNDWAIGGPVFPIDTLRRYIGRGNSDFGELEQLFDTLDRLFPEWEDTLESYSSDIERAFDRGTEPTYDDLTYSEVGARLKGSASVVDFAASYLYSHDDFPTLHINQEVIEFGRLLSNPLYNVRGIIDTDLDDLLPLFHAAYHPVHTVGAEFGALAGSFNLRGEAAYTIGRYTYKKNLDAVKRDVITWSASVEYTFSNGLILQGQYVQTVYPFYTGDMIAKEFSHTGIVLLRHTFLRDTLELYLLGIYDFTYVGDDDVGGKEFWEQDWAVLPMMTYKITDALHLRWGAEIFYGDEFSPLGYLADNSQVFVGVTWNF